MTYFYGILLRLQSELLVTFTWPPLLFPSETSASITMCLVISPTSALISTRL